jgi:hypothetical protein
MQKITRLGDAFSQREQALFPQHIHLLAVPEQLKTLQSG